MTTLNRAKQGDELAIEEIINEFRPMLKALCRQYFLTGMDSDDLMQEAMLGLIQAVNLYDNKRNDNFKSFARLCAQSKLLSAYKRQNRQKCLLLNSAIGIDSEGALISGDESGLIVAVSDQDFVADMMKKESNHARAVVIKSLLDSDDYQILQKYLQGYKYDEIAGSMHITTKKVDNRLQAIKRTLTKNKDKVLKGE